MLEKISGKRWLFRAQPGAPDRGLGPDHFCRLPAILRSDDRRRGARSPRRQQIYLGPGSAGRQRYFAGAFTFFRLSTADCLAERKRSFALKHLATFSTHPILGIGAVFGKDVSLRSR